MTPWPGVTDHLAGLADGSVTSVSLVSEVLSRVTEHDGRLGAVRVLRADAALAEAAACDARRAAGGDQLGQPLWGLPLLVKESHAVAGLVGALGTRSAERPATADAPFVAALRAAGCVVVGTTTMPELALWPFGPAANPWDLARTSGGSSSGSAAAVAAGLVAVATGSDGGGSIRLPAAMCGLVGLKVAPGQLPGGGGWHGLSVDGVLTRSVADTAVVLDAVLPPGSPSLAAAAARPPGPLRVAWWGRAPVPPHAGAETAAMLAAVVARLGRLGHATAEVDPGWSRPAGLAALAFVPRYTAGAAADLARLADPAVVQGRTALVAGLGRRVPARAVAASARRGSALRARMLRRLAGHDVLVLPTVPGPAPLAAPLLGAGRFATVLGASRLAAYTSPINAAGLASLSLPAGRSADGLPLAVQLVAPDDDLARLVSLAAQLESDWDAGHPVGFAREAGR